MTIAQPAGVPHGRVFVRPYRPMYWVYIGLFVFGALQYGSLMLRFAELTPTAMAISVVMNALLAFVVIKLINWLDLFEREPTALLTAAFGWGAVVATAIAVHSNDLALSAVAKLGLSAWGDALAAPVNEETLKLLGVIVVAVIGRDYIHRAMDGLVLGMMCGLGFEVAENLLYGVQTAIADVNSDISAAIATNVGRLLLGVGGHVMFTGITGLGIGYFMTRKDRSVANRVLAFIGTFVIAWSLHFLWDSPLGGGLILMPLVKYAIEIVAFFLLYRYAARREWDWFAATMSNQPSTVITSDELASMRTLRSRRKARRRAKRAEGRSGRQRVRYLQDSQLGYAIAVNRSRDPEHDPAVRARWADINEIRAEEPHDNR